MMINKLRVVKDYEKLTPEIQEQIKLVYPYGFSQHLITYTDRDGKLVSALPFETDDRYYLVRMTSNQAQQIISEDDDYDDEGILKVETKEKYADKYSEVDYLSEAGVSDEEISDEEDDYDDDDYGDNEDDDED